MDQLELLGARGRKKRRNAAPPADLAAHLPVAGVLVDVKALAVSREFDYAVPAKLSDQVRTGCRVRVAFHGRLVDGFVVERRAQAQVSGELAPIRRVISGPQFTPQTLELVGAVASRYAGSLAEVLRDAIPPTRSRRPSREHVRDVSPGRVTRTRITEGASALVAALDRDGRSRVLATVAVTEAAEDWLAGVITQLQQPLLVLVPDHDLLERIRAGLRNFHDQIAYLSSGDDAAVRQREFGRVIDQQTRIVVGTRHAVFAPVAGATVVLWDDANPLFSEPRSPGWHAREVAAIRAHLFGEALVIAGHWHSVEAHRLLAHGWLTPVAATAAQRQAGPVVHTSRSSRADDPAARSRLPQFAWRTLTEALSLGGPVLVQVGRSGYYPSLRCTACQTLAHCENCGSALTKSAEEEIVCEVCGWQGWKSCAHCQGSQLKPIRVGSSRTAVELAASFPDANIVVSSAKTGVIRDLSADVDIAVATIGAEPRAPGEYQAALLLDGDAMLARTDLRNEEQTLRHWYRAASLVRPRAQGGMVAVTAAPTSRSVQSLLRYDVATWGRNELAARTEAGLPPAVRSAVASGSHAATEWFVAHLAGAERDWSVLGPIPIDAQQSRVIVLTPYSSGPRLAELVRDTRLALERRNDLKLRVRIDPLSLIGGA